MTHDIAAYKQALPLDRMMAKLGLFEHVQKKAFCPFHEDNRHSFSVVKLNGNGWHWHCFAGCGQGDEIDFLKVMFNLHTKAAIERYADLAGMGKCQAWDAVKRFQGKVVPFSGERTGSCNQPEVGTKAESDGEPLPAAKLEPLSTSAAIKIADWRGLKPEFVAEMSDKGIIGLYNKCPAFTNGPGSVQYRLKDGTWRYAPAGSETKALLIERSSTARWFIVESQWDALALAECAPELNVICTRGMANAALASDYFNKRSDSPLLVPVPHNDKPGDKWLDDLRHGLDIGNPLLQRHEFKVKRVPAPFKDFAEWYKARKANRA